MEGLLEKIRRGHEELQRTAYSETFDAFCKNLIATDLLSKDGKQLIRGLLEQWRRNKERE